MKQATPFFLTLCVLTPLLAASTDAQTIVGQMQTVTVTASAPPPIETEDAQIPDTLPPISTDDGTLDVVDAMTPNIPNPADGGSGDDSPQAKSAGPSANTTSTASNAEDETGGGGPPMADLNTVSPYNSQGNVSDVTSPSGQSGSSDGATIDFAGLAQAEKELNQTGQPSGSAPTPSLADIPSSVALAADGTVKKGRLTYNGGSFTGLGKGIAAANNLLGDTLPNLQESAVEAQQALDKPALGEGVPVQRYRAQANPQPAGD